MAAYAAELKNGSSASYTFSFERISDDYVKVQHLVNGTWTDVLKTDATHPWSITGSTNTITMTSTQFPAGTGTVRIYRETPLTDLPVEFQSGSALAASQLNENYEQNFQAIQEISDHFLDKQTARLDGNVDMNNNDLLNVKAIQFEGSTVDNVHTTLSVLDPDTNKTINLPNVSGTVPVMETVPTAHIQATVAEIDQLHDVTDGTVAASKFVAVSADKDITGFRDLSITRNLDVDGDIDVDGTANVDALDVDGNADISGNTVLHGNVQLGDAATDEIDFQGQINSDLVPLADNTRSLGTSAKQWKDLHINGTAAIDQLNADSVDIDAGNIDGTTIGANTAAEATVTNLSVTGNTTLGNADTDDVTFTASLNSDIVPKTNDSRSLGTTSKKFANVHSTTFTGALSGNASSATTSAHVTITAEANVDEENRLTFVEDAQGAGSRGLEVDNDLTWNPNTGKLSATKFKGPLEGKSDTTGKLHAAVNVAGVSFDGSQSITIPLNNLSDVNVGTPGAPQDGQVLAWDNTNSEFALSATAGGGSGLSDVVSDGTPQLGGDLDVNGNKIVTDSNNDNVIIAAHGTGGLQVGNSANNSKITTSGNENLNLDPGGTGDIVLDGVFTINDEGFTYNNTLATPEEVFGLDIETNGDPKLKVSTSGLAETGEFQVFFGDPNAGANARGVRLWAGDTSNKTGRVTIEGRVDGSQSVFDVNTSANDSTSLSNKITFDASGKAVFQELDINGTATFDGNVTIEDGASLILQNADEDETISINADDVTDSYNLTLPPTHGTAEQVLRINSVDANDNVELEWGTIDVSTAPRLEHSNTTNGFIIAADSNALMVGPLTINSGQEIKIGPGGNGSNANSVFKII